MEIQLPNRIPPGLRNMLTHGLQGMRVGIDGNDYRIEGWNTAGDHYLVRRLRGNGELVPDAATENIRFDDIRQLVIY